MSDPRARPLCIVGGGNMGGAMLRRWIASGMFEATDITVVDPGNPEVPAGVRLVTGAPTIEDMCCRVIVLAVKPQQIDQLRTPALHGQGPQLLLSVVAGVEAAIIAELCDWDDTCVARAMPNLPVGIGKGVVAVFSAGSDKIPEDREYIEYLLAPFGLIEWIDDENLFHAVTALSGSGPGFVYRFIEALAEAGTALGLPAGQAQRFAIATVEGAAALAEQAGESPAVLADRVASPGGTTRAGLNVLDRGDAMKRLVAETLTAAAHRSAEMAEAARK